MKKHIILFALFLLCACIREVQVDLPAQESVPVLNVIINPDSLIRTGLTETQPIFDQKNTEVTGAVLRLFQDGELLETGRVENGNYLTGIFPEINKNYRLEVDMPSSRLVVGSETIPTKPVLLSASFANQVALDDEGYELSNAQITIRDDPDTDNYYELIFSAFFSETDTTSLTFFQSEPSFSSKNDLVLENENILDYFDFVNPVFSDVLFNGEAYTLNVKYYPATITFFDNFRTVYQSENHDLIVILRSISKDYYTYKKRLLQHTENQYSDVWDGAGEPAPMFTNIKNGYGIFAGYSQVTDTVFRPN